MPSDSGQAGARQSGESEKDHCRGDAPHFLIIEDGGLGPCFDEWPDDLKAKIRRIASQLGGGRVYAFDDNDGSFSDGEDGRLGPPEPGDTVTIVSPAWVSPVVLHFG